LNSFRLKSLETTPSTADHEVKIYRFWSYDLTNGIPSETVYFLKMTNIINFTNPVFYKNKFASSSNATRKPDYPVDNRESDRIANYLLHSEKFPRITSFMLYDHVNDEIRHTSRFSNENSFKMFKSKPYYKSQLFDRQIKITLDHYLFCYINALSSTTANADIELSDMKGHYRLQAETGKVTGEALLRGHFDNLLKNSIVDKYLRSAFINSAVTRIPHNYYKINLFSSNDLTIISNEMIETDELIEYVVKNYIDLVVSLNVNTDLLKNFGKIQPLKVSESILSNSNVKELNRKKIDFTFKVGDFLERDKSNSTEMEYSVSEASIRHLDLKDIHENKKNADNLSNILLSIFNKDSNHERVVIVSRDEKLTALFTICVMNLMQAQVEK
jgi:hypothetical protein